MVTGSGIYPIYLSKPVTGRAIANAVKTIAEGQGCKAVCELETRSVNHAFQLGQTGNDSEMELRIEAPYGAVWSGLFELAGAYDRLRVVSWSFRTRKYRMGSNAPGFRDLVESFRDTLVIALDTARQTDPA